MTLSVCIATYRRPERLKLLLSDLAAQSLLPDEVIVVDNDASSSARPVIEEFRGHSPFVLQYAVQPERNIALTRNRSVELANGDWLAFVDDDERAPQAWLAQLLDAAQRLGADAVLGPVVPVVPPTAPAWIRRGRFYEFSRFRTGDAVPLNCMRFGNVILRGEPLRAEPGPFDIAYGLTTGEDADLLIRLVQKGARVIWCDEAVVSEPIEPARQSLRWLLQRALSGGQEFARKTMAGRYGTVTLALRLKLVGNAAAKLAIAALCTVLALPFGRHRVATWLIKASANLGKLSIFWGWRYSEYA